MREHARGRGLAVRAGYRRNRHAGWRAGREQHVDDGAADIAWRALAGCHVHAEARAGIDLADRTACFAVRQRDVLRQEIDAADVQADGLDGTHRHLPVIGMYRVRHVDRRAARRQVRGGPQVDHLVLGRHGIPVVTDLAQQALRLVVELEARQDLLVTHAAAWVLVDDCHEFFDGVLAVADDMAGLALCGRDELAVDDEQAVVMTFDVALDDDGTAVFLRLLERDLDFVGRLQVDGDAAAVVSVQRLQYHREADRPGRPHGILSAANQALLGHRQA